MVGLGTQEGVTLFGSEVSWIERMRILSLSRLALAQRTRPALATQVKHPHALMPSSSSMCVDAALPRLRHLATATR